MMTDIEKITDTKTITLSSIEYEYLKNLLDELYRGFSKLPKKARTDKYYLLENIIKDNFS